MADRYDHRSLEYYKRGSQQQVFTAVEVTGKKPITFAQFAKDHVDAFI